MNSVFSTSHRFQFNFNETTTVTSLKQKRKHFFAWISVTVILIIAFTHFANVAISFWFDVTSPVFHQIYNRAYTFDDCPPGSFYYCPSNKKCLTFNQQCDRHQDCPNDFDEQNCRCLHEEYACNNGRCISKLFLCDGVMDCPDGDDEAIETCEKCPFGEFRCEGFKPVCLKENLVCNGKIDCSYGEDERCVSFKKNNELRLRVSSIKGNSVCYDNWNQNLSDYFCEKANKGLSIESFPLKQRKNIKPVTLKNFKNNNFSVTQSETCPNKEIVGIKCYQEECGRRKVDERLFRTYLIYGEEILQGEHPWFVYLKCNGFTCGAALIGDRWVLTAGHCVYIYNMEESHCNVFMGSVYSQQHKWTFYEVEEIILKEDYSNEPLENDIALLKLKQPVVYTSYIQPICLPHKTYSEQDYQECYSAGVGKTKRDKGSEKLMKLRMTVKERESTQALVCIGTSRGNDYPNICMGDSGGPFMCRKRNENTWVLIGVHSFVRFKDHVGNKPSAKMCQLSFAERVNNYVDWIREKQQFHA